MKILRFILTAWLMTFCFAYSGYSQAGVGNDRLPGSDYIELPPLSELIDSAVNHNALMRVRNSDINAKASNLKSQSNFWIKNMGVQADSRYGTFNNFSTNTAEGQTPSIIATNTSQFNYGVGVYLKFPIYDIVNRKNQVSQAKAELDVASNLADAQRDELRQVVIKQYNDVILKQRLLNIASQNLGNSRINMDMIEKEFQNGSISVSEYVRISDLASRTESEYEQARMNYITAFMVLEEIVGFKLNSSTIKNNENN
jgi:outer membrane protein TolC